MINRAMERSAAALDDLRLPRPAPRRIWSRAVLFAACALLVNGVFGERGLTETLHARRALQDAAHDLASLKQQNAGLRKMARDLRSDPVTIEAVARGDLGLIRRGEILVTIHALKN